MGGGIGVTPMIAFAHRLDDLGKNFVLHYSASRTSDAGYLKDLETVQWRDNLNLHLSDKGTRADMCQIFSSCEANSQIYVCGSERYMDSVVNAAKRNNIPEENIHLEYFSVPEEPDYVDYDFTLRLTKSGKEFLIPANKTATDILKENGFGIDIKCSDGICGVCKCGLISGDVEHRDFVLSKQQRHGQIILCKSRALEENGIVEIDM